MIKKLALLMGIITGGLIAGPSFAGINNLGSYDHNIVLSQLGGGADATDRARAREIAARERERRAEVERERAAAVRETRGLTPAQRERHLEVVREKTRERVKEFRSLSPAERERRIETARGRVSEGMRDQGMDVRSSKAPETKPGSRGPARTHDTSPDIVRGGMGPGMPSTVRGGMGPELPSTVRGGMGPGMPSTVRGGMGPETRMQPSTPSSLDTSPVSPVGGRLGR